VLILIVTTIAISAAITITITITVVTRVWGVGQPSGSVSTPAAP
jgi:hypothetical protein